MATNIQLANFTSSTSTGTQDFTISGFGTPQIVIFINNGAYLTAQDTPTNHAILAIGVVNSDGSVHFNLECRDNNAVGTTDSQRWSDDDRVVIVPDDDSTWAAYTDGGTAITDGIRLNWDSNGLTTGIPITAIFINGLTDYDISNVTLSTENTEVNVTAPGFEPDALIAFSISYDNPDSTTSDMVYSLGFAVNDGSDTQCGLAIHSRDAVGTSELTAEVFSDALAAQVFDGALTYSVQASNFDADGYSLTAIGGDSGGDLILVIAIQTEKEVWCGVQNTPTSTGNKSFTGVGFQPDFVFALPNMISAVDTLKTDGEAGVFAISVTDDSSEFCHALAMEDNVATSNTESAFDDVVVSVNDHDGSAAFDATHVSMDSDGWTWSFNTTDGTARKWPCFAIGESGGTTYYQSCSGSMPSGSGVISSKITYGQTVAGDMPAAQGDLIKKILKSLSGNFPSQAGSLVKSISKQVAGDMPAPIGQAVKKTLISLAGNMPSATGDVAGVLANITQSIFGNFPAPSGTLIKKIVKRLSGSMGAITGSLTKKTGKGLSGAMPSAAGDLSSAWNTKESVSGDMPAPSGVLSAILNPVSTVRTLMKIIGSAFKKIIG